MITSQSRYTHSSTISLATSNVSLNLIFQSAIFHWSSWHSIFCALLSTSLSVSLSSVYGHRPESCARFSNYDDKPADVHTNIQSRQVSRSHQDFVWAIHSLFHCTQSQPAAGYDRTTKLLENAWRWWWWWWVNGCVLLPSFVRRKLAIWWLANKHNNFAFLFYVKGFKVRKVREVNGWTGCPIAAFQSRSLHSAGNKMYGPHRDPDPWLAQSQRDRVRSIFVLFPQYQVVASLRLQCTVDETSCNKTRLHYARTENEFRLLLLLGEESDAGLYLHPCSTHEYGFDCRPRTCGTQ